MSVERFLGALGRPIKSKAALYFQPNLESTIAASVCQYASVEQGGMMGDDEDIGQS